MKKKILILLSFMLLLNAFMGNYVSGVRLNAMSGNNEHFKSEDSTNSVFIQNSVNDLSINKYEERTIEETSVKSEKEVKTTEAKDVDILNDDDYEIIYENNTETELFLYNATTNDMKIIQYFEPTLILGEDGLYRPFEASVKMRRDGSVNIEGVDFNKVINEETPLYYSQYGVDFAYYLKNEDLKQLAVEDNVVSYKSTNGLIIAFSVENKKIVTKITVEDSSIEESSEVLKILNNYNFSEDDAGFFVNSELGDVRIKSFDNADMISHAFSLDGVDSEKPFAIHYEMDVETLMLISKLKFESQEMEKFEDDVELIIEHQSVEVTAPAGERFFRGTRSYKSSAIYPYGIDAAPGINNNYGVNDEYIRIGARNFSRETGYEPLHISSIGFFEDRVNYKNYFENYHQGKTVIDNGERRDMLPVTIDSATLAITPTQIGGTASLGAYLKTYYPNMYGDMKSKTVGGTGNVNYTLSIIEGSGLDPRSLTHDNYHSLIPSLTTSPASGGVASGATTFINMDTPAGTPHKFDITNAISKWTRYGYTGPQVIRIQSDSWDLYINKHAYVELSVREMPNFAQNDLKLSDTTVNLRAFTSNDQKGSVVTQGISIDGLTSYEAYVTYEIYDEKTKDVVHAGITKKPARETYAYPYYDHKIDKAQNYYRLESNYQSEEIIPIKKFETDRIYGVRVQAGEKGEQSEWIEGDKFQIYKVGYKFETFNRILNFYGRSTEALNAESKIDNNMINPVISEKNTLFIRNPQKNAGKTYVASDLSDADKWLIDGGLMGMNLKCEYGFEPINFNSGNFFYNITDGVIFNGQDRIDINRYYNSKKGGVDSAFGRNWTSVFDAKLQILNNGSIAFEDETGRVHVMTKNEDESYNTSYGEGYSFEMLEVGEYSKVIDSDYYIPAFNMSPKQKDFKTPMYHYVITDNNETRYYFNDLMQLIKIEQKTGQAFSLEYNYYGVSKVISDTNKELILNYNDAGYISELVYPTGSKSKYLYDEVGNLISYEDGEGYIVEYKYEDESNEYLMTSYNMKDEEDLIQNTYDEFGRITVQIDGNGTVSKLTYNEDHTVVEDANGNVKKVYFNELGYTTKVIDNGEVTEYKLDGSGNIIEESSYDANGESKIKTNFEFEGNKLKSVTKKTGEVNTLDYDKNKNISKLDNGRYVTTFEYDESSNLIKTGDVVNGETRYEYNDKGYLTKTINAFGGTTENIYDDNMNLIKKISPTGETLYEYDENGTLVAKTNEFGGRYVYKRNLRGEIVETTDPYGNKEYFEFNGMGKLVAKQDLNGNIINLSYDSIGNLVEEVNAYGSVKYKYDDVYNLVETIDANNNSTKYEYDEKNQLIKTIHPNGNEVVVAYDAFGNIIEETDSIGLITKNSYNEIGQLSLKEEASGKVLEYQYDELGRIVKSYENDVAVETNVYNEYGQLATTYNAMAMQTDYEYINNKLSKTIVASTTVSNSVYGSNERVVNTLDSYDNASTTEYTSENNILRQIDRDGVVTEYKYDLVGRIIETYIGGEKVSSNEYYPSGQVQYSYDGNGNKTEYVLDYADRLSAQIDAKGNTTSYKYDGNGNAIEIKDPYENVINYEYDNMNNIVKVIDPINRAIEYKYNLRNQEIEIIYPDGTVELKEYNNANQLVKTVSRDKIETYFEFDLFGRVVKEYDSTGRSSFKRYDEIGNVLSQTNHGNQTTEYKYDILGRVVKETTFDGNETVYLYDHESRVVEMIDPLENSIYKEYTKEGRLTLEVAINGGETRYEYDNLGRNVKVINPLNEITSTSYDLASNVIMKHDGKGLITNYTYDELNQMVKETSALGITRITEYNAKGNVVSEIDGRGNKTSYNYDEASRLIEIIDALGFKSTSIYDINDNLITTTDANEVATDYEYDVMGRVTQTKYDTGAITKTNYDERGNVIEEIDGNNNSVKYEYDSLDRLIKQEEANGNILEYEYNEKGDLVEEKDSLGVIAKYEYNKVHNVIAKEDALGKVELYTYCDCGGIIDTLTDTNGNTIKYEYDLLNRMVKQTDERGNDTAFTYDESGNTTSLVLNDTRVFSYEFDGDNRLVKDINPLNDINNYKYDENNNQIEKTDGNGNAIKYEYDELNRQTKIIDGEENETIYEYDGVNLIKETDENGNSTKYEYDGVGNIIKVENAKEEVTNYSYDNNNNLKYISMNLRFVQTNEYDESNNLIMNKDDKKITTTYEYDLRNNQIGQTNNDGRTIISKYNELNQLISQLSEDVEVKNNYDKYGRLVEASDNGEVTNLKYNSFNDIVEYTDENGNIIKYSYDEYGNKTSVVYSDGREVKYEYDELDRLIKIVDVDGNQTSYRYDSSGNRVNEQLPNNMEVRSEYNRNNQIINKEYYKNNQIILKLSYEYNPNGQVKKEIKEESGEDESEDDLTTVKEYEYDELNQLVKSTYNITKGTESEKIIYEYNYNIWNDRQEVKITKNGITETISEETNSSGQITSRSGDDFATKYEYDEVGNITKETNEDGTTLTYEYNGLNQLIAVYSSSGYYEVYEYDGLGNRVEKQAYTPYNVYDSTGFSGKLTLRQELEELIKEDASHKDKESETKNLREELQDDINCDNIKEDTLIDKEVIMYVNDVNTEHARVLEVQGKSYQRNIFDESYAVQTNDSVNILDHKGSVVGEISEELRTNEYTPQGAMFSSKLINSNQRIDRIGFSNEIHNNFNLQYLRARYYNQETARFISQDTYKGETGKPVTHNLYTYVGNDAVNNIDPSGNIFDWIKEKYEDAKDWLGDKVDNFTDWVKDKVNGVIDFVSGLTNVIGNVIVNGWSYITSGVQNIYQTVAGNIEKHFNIIMNKFCELLENSIEKALDMIDEFAGDYIDTAEFAAAVLDMEKDGEVYYATFDGWQQYFGYNDLYDIMFDLATDMEHLKFPFEGTDEKEYILWAWKGDYINLGMGAELGIYTDGNDGHWNIDKKLAMPMTINVTLNKIDDQGVKSINIINRSGFYWWITGFNPNYKNYPANALSATFTVDFSSKPNLLDGLRSRYPNGKAGLFVSKTSPIVKVSF